MKRIIRNPFAECYRAAEEGLACSLRDIGGTYASPQGTAREFPVYEAFFQEAWQFRQLFPYAYLVGEVVTRLSAQPDQQKFVPYWFDRLQQYGRRFERLHRIAERHIQLQVIPSALDGTKVLFPSAKVIIPTAIPREIGFHAYALFFSGSQASASAQPPSSQEEPIANEENGLQPYEILPDIEQLTETPCFSLDDALDRYTNSRDCCTIAFAQNAEYFPLVETALPIVFEKYETALFPPEEVSG